MSKEEYEQFQKVLEKELLILYTWYKYIQIDLMTSRPIKEYAEHKECCKDILDDLVQATVSSLFGGMFLQCFTYIN